MIFHLRNLRQRHHCYFILLFLLLPWKYLPLSDSILISMQLSLALLFLLLLLLFIVLCISHLLFVLVFKFFFSLFCSFISMTSFSFLLAVYLPWILLLYSLYCRWCLSCCYWFMLVEAVVKAVGNSKWSHLYFLIDKWWLLDWMLANLVYLIYLSKEL